MHYKAQVSNDTLAWQDVGWPSIFTGSMSSMQVEGRFPQMYPARYVKLVVMSWGAWLSVRAGAILCEDTDSLEERTEAQGSAPELDTCNYIQYSPPERFRTYSSVKDDDCPGEGHATSMLSSYQAWSASTDQSSPGEEYIIMDMGQDAWIVGILTQARADKPWELIDEYGVEYMVDGGDDWTTVDKTFQGSQMFFMPKVDMLPSMVKARYVKVFINKFTAWPSVRAGLMACEPMDEPAQPWTMSLLTSANE